MSTLASDRANASRARATTRFYMKAARDRACAVSSHISIPSDRRLDIHKSVGAMRDASRRWGTSASAAKYANIVCLSFRLTLQKCQRYYQHGNHVFFTKQRGPNRRMSSGRALILQRLCSHEILEALASWILRFSFVWKLVTMHIMTLLVELCGSCDAPRELYDHDLRACVVYHKH